MKSLAAYTYVLFVVRTATSRCVTGNTGDANANPNKLRDRCVKLMETFYPPRRWQTVEDVQSFAKLRSEKADATTPVLSPLFATTYNLSDRSVHPTFATGHFFSEVVAAGQWCSFQWESHWGRVGCVNPETVFMELDDAGRWKQFIITDNPRHARIAACTPGESSPLRALLVPPVPTSQQGPTAVVDPTALGQTCYNAWMTLFPEQRYATKKDMRAFADEIWAGKDSSNYLYHSSPKGVPKTNVTNQQLFHHLLEEMKPSSPTRIIAPIIGGGISVSTSRQRICTFETLWAILKDQCWIDIPSRQLLEFNANDKIVRWIHHFDVATLDAKQKACCRSNANAPTLMTESPDNTITASLTFQSTTPGMEALTASFFGCIGLALSIIFVLAVFSVKRMMERRQHGVLSTPEELRSLLQSR